MQGRITFLKCNISERNKIHFDLNKVLVCGILICYVHLQNYIIYITTCCSIRLERNTIRFGKTGNNIIKNKNSIIPAVFHINSRANVKKYRT